jgi:hypothetical protein
MLIASTVLVGHMVEQYAYARSGKNEQEAHGSGAVLAEYDEADHAGSRMDRRRQGKTRMEEPAVGAGRACARLPLLGLTTVGSRTWTCCCCRRWQGCIGSAAWRRW